MATSLNMPELGKLPLGRFVAFVWWWATRNATERADVDKFERQLWRPPPGEIGRGPWSAEAETAAFAAVKRGLRK